MTKSSPNDNSYLFAGNSSFVESLYEQFISNPASVSEEWRNYFKSIGAANDRPHIRPSPFTVSAAATATVGDSTALDALRVKLLVEAYHTNGHLLTALDPLELEQLPDARTVGLNIENFGFSNADLPREVNVGHVLQGKSSMKLSELVACLQAAYSRNIGVEFVHIENAQERAWIASRIEAIPAASLTVEQKKKTLRSLLEAEGLEQFLHVRFQGVKRFSIEGGENSITAVEHALDYAVANNGLKTAVIGMAHRGRLNMLTKVMGKPYHLMLWEFQSNPSHPSSLGISGDVKYHLGYAGDRPTLSGGKVHLSMVPNPSHLEAVNPVVAGKVRCEQDLLGDAERSQVMGITLHGDAAFAGQGVVMESLVLSELNGYYGGGMLRIVVNNQVGFTTSPYKARNSRYPTEVGKVAKAPIFHVHGDKAEDVAQVARLMAEYRAKFKKDAVMNLVCYRLYGHNEGDEPLFTQPIMYERIAKKETPATIYANKLIADGVVQQTEVDAIKQEFRQFLDNELLLTKDFQPKEAEWCKSKWQKMVWSQAKEATEETTGVAEDALLKIGKALTLIPDSTHYISKYNRLFEAKKHMFEAGAGLDWAAGEALAFGSLLLEGCNVRLSGQDAGRGTFSHRNSVILDVGTEKPYFPLNNIAPKQARYDVIDSPLSEYAVIGFEYGFSAASPENLVLWEAQFGDFSNGAQIMIDQFIASAETKWQRMSGLVMLLPHGFEGQGPEHSSARLERYLQLCAEGNMAVVNCSTPASYFHAIRRQMKRNFRRPLIVMTPKSLLRHKLAISNIAEMSTGTAFKPVLPETHNEVQPAKVKRVVLCSGKVYYDLYEQREKSKNYSVALLRLEQFYPYPEAELQQELATYKDAELVWCQEEPKNQGAWSFVAPLLTESLTKLGAKNCIPIYAGRVASASPAIGAYSKIHAAEQAALVNNALGA